MTKITDREKHIINLLIMWSEKRLEASVAISKCYSLYESEIRQRVKEIRQFRKAAESSGLIR